jgi:uncharacterized protein (TIGR02996 family)
MPHNEILLQALRVNPADDGLRLVYADWLEEHGESERAEFIRVDYALTHQRPHDPARRELEWRWWGLRRKHERDWLGNLRGSLKRWQFRLGLLEAVTITAERFLAHADILFRLGPLRVVEFQRAAGRTVALAACPQLAYLETISLSYNFLTDAAARDLACSPHLANLQELCLAHNSIRAAGAEALARSPNLAGLRKLDLTNNPYLGNAGREALRARFGDRVHF